MRFENVLFLTIITLVTLTLTIVPHVMTSAKGSDSDFAYAFNDMSSGDFNFAAVGDWGCTSNTKNMVNNIIDKDPELVLGLGDYAYRQNAECWFQLVDPIDHKMKIVIGNHDARAIINKTSLPSPTRLQQYMDHFNLSRQYYSFDHQNVHFIAMSNEVPFELGSKQYNFVASDLKETVSEPNIKWIIVFHHKLEYTSPISSVSAIAKFRDTYHPLFEKYSVDLVIQAHSHTYQRSYPIKYNPGNSSSPLIMDKNTTNYNDPNRQIFITVGTGGASTIDNFTGPAAEYMAVQFKAFGFLNLGILHNGSTLVGEFQDNDGYYKRSFHYHEIKQYRKQIAFTLFPRTKNKE